MHDFDEGDWLAQRLRVLRPGWRGRLLLRAPEEAKRQDHEELIGTVVDEPAFDNDESNADDPTITVCANHRAGRFVALADEPRYSIRVSRIAGMESM